MDVLYSCSKILVIRKPEITKNIFTPNPPTENSAKILGDSGKCKDATAWLTSTKPIEIARNPSRDGILCCLSLVGGEYISILIIVSAMAFVFIQFMFRAAKTLLPNDKFGVNTLKPFLCISAEKLSN